MLSYLVTLLILLFLLIILNLTQTKNIDNFDPTLIPQNTAGPPVPINPLDLQSGVSREKINSFPTLQNNKPSNTGPINPLDLQNGNSNEKMNFQPKLENNGQLNDIDMMPIGSQSETLQNTAPVQQNKNLDDSNLIKTNVIRFPKYYPISYENPLLENNNLFTRIFDILQRTKEIANGKFVNKLLFNLPNLPEITTKFDSSKVRPIITYLMKVMNSINQDVDVFDLVDIKNVIRSETAVEAEVSFDLVVNYNFKFNDTSLIRKNDSMNKVLNGLVMHIVLLSRKDIIDDMVPSNDYFEKIYVSRLDMDQNPNYGFLPGRLDSKALMVSKDFDEMTTVLNTSLVQYAKDVDEKNKAEMENRTAKLATEPMPPNNNVLQLQYQKDKFFIPPNK